MSKPWLAYAREHAEHSQASLGKKVGVTGCAIYNYEKGIQIPSVSIRQKIAEELGIPVSWFYKRPLGK